MSEVDVPPEPKLPWGVQHWRHVDCGPGWFPLIQELHENLFELDPNYLVLQVKEKFGGLRYYISTTLADKASNDRIWGLIADAERKSQTICEMCGKPGIWRNDLHRIRTLCNRCLEIQLAEQARIRG